MECILVVSLERSIDSLCVYVCMYVCMYVYKWLQSWINVNIP